MGKVRENVCCKMVNIALAEMIEVFCTKYYPNSHWETILGRNDEWLNDTVVVGENFFDINEIYQALYFHMKAKDLHERADMKLEWAGQGSKPKMCLHAFLLGKGYHDLSDSE